MAGVRATANALGIKLDLDSYTAFRQVYGSSSNDPLRFVMGSCGSRNGRGGCANVDGQMAGAYTWSSHEIEFYFGQPFVSAGGNRSGYEAYGASVHTVVHELGHAFAARLSSSTIDPYAMMEDARFNDGENYTSNFGFAISPDPISASGYWRPNSSTSKEETFANMYVGWVYGAWGNDDYGTQRGSYMAKHMANTWLPAMP